MCLQIEPVRLSSKLQAGAAEEEDEEEDEEQLSRSNRQLRSRASQVRKRQRNLQVQHLRQSLQILSLQFISNRQSFTVNFIL